MWVPALDEDLLLVCRIEEVDPDHLAWQLQLGALAYRSRLIAVDRQHVISPSGLLALLAIVCRATPASERVVTKAQRLGKSRQ
jgi:hypothetical protein